VNPINLGSESSGSLTIGFDIVIVAMPIPDVTVPATDTPGPTKFNCVIEFATPTTLPSSLTVIP
jgi:hypothetical protein